MTNRILFVLMYMLLGVPVRVSAETIVTVSAGKLQKLFDANNLMHESNLTLEGTINGSDVKVLRKWANSKRTLNLLECPSVSFGIRHPAGIGIDPSADIGYNFP